MNLKKIEKNVAGTERRQMAIEFCLAHEIGHLISVNNFNAGFTSGVYGSFLEELICDQKAGAVIAMLHEETTGDELVRLLPILLNDIEVNNPSHPPLIARVMYIKSGWLETKMREENNIDIDKASRMLSGDRFLAGLNTFDDNILAFKIRNFNDHTLSYLEVPPKNIGIIAKSETAEEDEDNVLDNVYHMGNDLTLYQNARFNYHTDPENRYEKTTIIFMLDDRKYTLRLSKGPKCNQISYTDANPAKSLIIYDDGKKAIN
jgi:hypothetical protein